MNYNVSFAFRINQEVYFLYKNYPKKGYIEEINISISNMYMEDGFWITEPIIKYRIKEKWYYERELWVDKKEFMKWLDKNLCYTKHIDTKANYCYFKDQKVFLLDIIERTNNKHPWKKKKIAEIFYTDENNKGFFRYVFYEDIKNPSHEMNYFDFGTNNTKYGLMKYYGMNYIEDGIYNFVNYDGIKF